MEQLFRAIAGQHPSLDAGLVEKDYWIMHCLWGIQQQGFSFELKGGTSLSKGFKIIERFSEDIDIQIHPDVNVKTGKNQNKAAHIESRKQFFDNVTIKLEIPGLSFRRDTAFDNKGMTSGGIRAEYPPLFDNVPGLKPGIVLELGFDKTAPYLLCDITSWAFEEAIKHNLQIVDNRAKQVRCYSPEYTFIEKLQTISTKYRSQQKENTMPINFLRHYYDVYKLLENRRVLSFIGTKDYLEYKDRKFGSLNEKEICKNHAFTMPDATVKKYYSDEFKKKSNMYYGNQPEFEEILQRISDYISQL